MNLLAELKRRNVLRAAALYIGAAWALSQGLAQLLPVFDIPNWVVRWFVIATIIGFPFALLFSWFYEWTPHGIQRERDVASSESVARATGKKLDRWIIAVLAVALVLLLADTFVLHKEATSALDKSVAVLPLVNESGDPQQDYFSDGLSEELISAIAQVQAIKVIGRSSSFRFRGREQDDSASIGVKLGVATLLEGTVRKQGDQVRIVASLIKAVDGRALWSHTYDRELKDVFAVQSEIATAVAGALKTALLGRTIESADKPPSGNLDAYNALLKGRFFAERRDRADYLKAVEYFQQAIKLDPDYTMAYARLAIATSGSTIGSRSPASAGQRRRSRAPMPKRPSRWILNRRSRSARSASTRRGRTSTSRPAKRRSSEPLRSTRRMPKRCTSSPMSPQAWGEWTKRSR